MSKLDTSHHKYLVALTFKPEKEEEEERIIIKIEKTDTDELMFEIDEKNYWVSYNQFLELVKSLEAEK